VRLIVGLAALTLLSACDNPWEPLPDIQKDVKVVAVNPPKRLYVTLRDESNGQETKVYVAKRCNGYERVPVGSRFKMPFIVSRHKETKEVVVEPNRNFLYQKFCG
jgi:hypothetical protein